MKKIFALILTIVSFLGLVSCGGAKPTSIVLNGELTYTYATKAEFEQNVGDISINVTYSDSTTKDMNVTLDMFAAEDLAKLDVAGTYNLTITYEKCSTSVEVTIVGDRYSVTVLYPNGDPVANNVAVQWCTGELCLLPVFVNSKGVAYNACADANYFIHIEGIPLGYTYDPNVYTSNASNKHITINLISITDLNDSVTDGSLSKPHNITDGAYIDRFTALSTSGMKYYAFTASESKEYTIRSINQDKLALNTVDPYIGFMGTELDMANIDVTGNDAVGINFSHTFTAQANTTYYFVIMISSADNAAKADCTFVIE